MKKDLSNGKHGDAYKAVRFIYDHSPGRSWQRLNGALSDTLSAAITARLSFMEDDFEAIYKDMDGGFWMGNSVGSQTGERYFSHAVKIGHLAACISFEKFAGRPAALWPERAKTPERLCIGSEFSWKGHRVQVTNLRADYLIACSYKDRDSDHGKPLVAGCVSYFHDGSGGHRTVDEVKRDNGALLLRLSPVIKNYDSSAVVCRFKIKYEELQAVRKEFDNRRKEALKRIAETATLEALREVEMQLSENGRDHYRHFDIEIISQAIGKRREAFSDIERETEQRAAQAASLERWLAGEARTCFFSEIRLRIKDDRVETSNGHSVTIKSASRLLPIALERRSKPGPGAGEQVDLYTVNEFTPAGVLIGCTLVPWAEVERLKALLPTRTI